jgi:hypothetical protein
MGRIYLHEVKGEPSETPTEIVLDGEQVGHVLDGAVSVDVVDAIDRATQGRGGNVSAETGLENQPMSTFEGFKDGEFTDEFFAAVEAVPGPVRRAISNWAAEARTVVADCLGLEKIVPAVLPDGRAFPEAIVRRTCNGILAHVDSVREEYPGTFLDLGPGCVQYSFITYRSNHPAGEGDLIVYGARPLELSGSNVSYPLDVASFGSVDTARVHPVKGRCVLTRSDNAHEVLPTTQPRAFVTMFVVVGADGRAISFG